MDLFDKSNYKINTEKIAQIKAWIYQKSEIDTEIPISINQLQCHEPNCPPIETVIAVMTTPPKQYKIHRSISLITEADIQQVLTS